MYTYVCLVLVYDIGIVTIAHNFALVDTNQITVLVMRAIVLLYLL